MRNFTAILLFFLALSASAQSIQPQSIQPLSIQPRPDPIPFLSADPTFGDGAIKASVSTFYVSRKDTDGFTYMKQVEDAAYVNFDPATCTLMIKSNGSCIVCDDEFDWSLTSEGYEVYGPEQSFRVQTSYGKDKTEWYVAVFKGNGLWTFGKSITSITQE